MLQRPTRIGGNRWQTGRPFSIWLCRSWASREMASNLCSRRWTFRWKLTGLAARRWNQEEGHQKGVTLWMCMGIWWFHMLFLRALKKSVRWAFCFILIGEAVKKPWTHCVFKDHEARKTYQAEGSETANEVFSFESNQNTQMSCDPDSWATARRLVS